MSDYRRTLRENLARSLERRQVTPEAFVAVYLAGPKKGLRVSARSIRYMMDKSSDSPAANLDTLSAVAHALELEPWQLLFPGLDPANPPAMRLSDAERDLYERFQRLRAELAGK